jgi:hypothetical protein
MLLCGVVMLSSTPFIGAISRSHFFLGLASQAVADEPAPVCL